MHSHRRGRRRRRQTSGAASARRRLPRVVSYLLIVVLLRLLLLRALGQTLVQLRMVWQRYSLYASSTACQKESHLRGAARSAHDDMQRL